MTRKQPVGDLRMIPIDRIEVLNPRDRNKAVFDQIVENIKSVGCQRRLNIEPPCRSNNEPGRVANS